MRKRNNNHFEDINSQVKRIRDDVIGANGLLTSIDAGITALGGDVSGQTNTHYVYDNIGAKVVYDAGEGVIARNRRVRAIEIVGETDSVYKEVDGVSPGIKSCVPLLLEGDFIKIPTEDTYPWIASESKFDRIEFGATEGVTATSGTIGPITLQSGTHVDTTTTPPVVHSVDFYTGMFIVFDGDATTYTIATSTVAVDNTSNFDITLTTNLNADVVPGTSYTIYGGGAWQVLILGWAEDKDDPTGMTWVKAAGLYNLNGSNPVRPFNPFTGPSVTAIFAPLGDASNLAGFARIIQGQVVQCYRKGFKENCFGNMYLADVDDLRDTATDGKPDSLSSCYAVCKANDGAFYTGYAYKPPGHQVFFSEHVLGSVSTLKDLQMKAQYFSRTQPFNGRGTQDTGWVRTALLTVQANQSSISAHQGSFPDLNSSLDGTQPTDFTICLSRIDGQANENAITVFSNLTGHIVGPYTPPA